MRLGNQSAPLVEESPPPASVMQDQAQDMRRLVGNFRLDADGHDPSSGALQPGFAQA